MSKHTHNTTLGSSQKSTGKAGKHHRHAHGRAAEIFGIIKNSKTTSWRTQKEHENAFKHKIKHRLETFSTLGETDTGE
jgi:hypothetical protein